MRPIDADKLIENHFSDDHRIAMSYADKLWMRRIINSEPTIEQYGTWIPCSEQLPGKHELCLITQRIGSQLVRKTALYTIGEWKYNGRTLKNDSVIAWMPLPEPYKGGDQNE